MNLTPYPIRALFAGLLTLGGYAASAQDVLFSASASPQKIGVKDRVQVTYTIENVADLESLEPAPSKDFSIAGGPMDARSSSYSVSNGQRTQKSSFSRTYILQPLRTGSLAAPVGVARTAGGTTYRSNAAGVKVVKGSAAGAWPTSPATDPFFSDPFFQSPFSAPPPEPPTKKVWTPQPGRDLFIRASVSKPTAYVGEAVVVTYRLYSRVTVQAALTEVPQASGAWTEELPGATPKPVDENIDGRAYRSVILKQVLLHPQQPGPLTLPPAAVEGYAQPPGDLYASADAFFGAAAMGGVPVRLQTSAVNISVLPVPGDGQPKGFSGAVGDLSLTAALDKQKTTIDAGAVLILTLRGRGAGRFVKLPHPDFPAGIDAYEPVVRDSVLADGSGIKTVRYALAVRKEGRYTIPTLRFSFFNPMPRKYQVLSTAPQGLEVTKNSASPLFASAKNAPEAGWMGKVLLALCIAGTASTAAYFIVRKKKAPSQPAPVSAKVIQPLPVAASSVPAGEFPAPEDAATHAALLKIFRQHLSLVLDLPLSALTKGAALRALDARGLPEGVQEAVHSVWQQCEAAVYAQGGTDVEEGVAETARAAALALDKIRLKLAA